LASLPFNFNPSFIYFWSSFRSALLISTVLTALVAASFAAAATAASNSAWVYFFSWSSPASFSTFLSSFCACFTSFSADSVFETPFPSFPSFYSYFATLFCLLTSDFLSSLFTFWLESTESFLGYSFLISSFFSSFSFELLLLESPFLVEELSSDEDDPGSALVMSLLDLSNISEAFLDASSIFYLLNSIAALDSTFPFFISFFKLVAFSLIFSTDAFILSSFSFDSAFLTSMSLAASSSFLLIS
jgi:hypothetical protein